MGGIWSTVTTKEGGEVPVANTGYSGLGHVGADPSVDPPSTTTTEQSLSGQRLSLGRSKRERQPPQSVSSVGANELSEKRGDSQVGRTKASRRKHRKKTDDSSRKHRKVIKDNDDEEGGTSPRKRLRTVDRAPSPISSLPTAVTALATTTSTSSMGTANANTTTEKIATSDSDAVRRQLPVRLCTKLKKIADEMDEKAPPMRIKREEDELEDEGENPWSAGDDTNNVPINTGNSKNSHRGSKKKGGGTRRAGDSMDGSHEDDKGAYTTLKVKPSASPTKGPSAVGATTKNSPKSSSSNIIPTGISYLARSDRWRVHLSLHGKMRHVGNFDTLEEAANAVTITRDEWQKATSGLPSPTKASPSKFARSTISDTQKDKLWWAVFKATKERLDGNDSIERIDGN